MTDTIQETLMLFNYGEILDNLENGIKVDPEWSPYVYDLRDVKDFCLFKEYGAIKVWFYQGSAAIIKEDFYAFKQLYTKIKKGYLN